MTHLTRQEVSRWRESKAPEDRERIVGHLAVCDECAALFDEPRDAEPMAALAPERRDELVALGYAAYRSVKPSVVTDIRTRLGAHWKMAAGLAAAAALVLSISARLPRRAATGRS